MEDQNNFRLFFAKQTLLDYVATFT